MQRNMTIDVMRVMGLLLIILAHVNPPGILFQFRTFDVPMMIFVSGVSFYLSKASSVVMTIVVFYAIEKYLPVARLPSILFRMSSNTIWIYLWHIPVVEYFYRYNPSVNFIIKYVFAVTIATILALTQKKIISKFFSKYRIMKVIFTG